MPTDVSSGPAADPSGTIMPSALRYSTNSVERGRIIVDFMLLDANVGYQEENWKARTFSDEMAGKAVIAKRKDQ